MTLKTTIEKVKRKKKSGLAPDPRKEKAVMTVIEVDRGPDHVGDHVQNLQKNGAGGHAPSLQKRKVKKAKRTNGTDPRIEKEAAMTMMRKAAVKTRKRRRQTRYLYSYLHSILY